MAVKIERRNEPTDEQLAASVILTGASALRMMRAERRQMGYISWKDLDPDEERRVLRTSSPSIEDIYLPDLVRIGPQAARCKKIFACWWDLRRSAAACLAWAGPYAPGCLPARF